MLYFLSAGGLPVFKVGVSDRPARRLVNCRTWPPVPLAIEAVDERGDFLTESEILWRMRHFHSHGEWFFASPEVRAIVAETRRSGSVPGGWYLPPGYDQRRFKSDAIRAALIPDLCEKFGIKITDLVSALNAPHLVAYRDSYGLPLRHVPALLEFFHARGICASYFDILARPRAKLAAAA